MANSSWLPTSPAQHQLVISYLKGLTTASEFQDVENMTSGAKGWALRLSKFSLSHDQSKLLYGHPTVEVVSHETPERLSELVLSLHQIAHRGVDKTWDAVKGKYVGINRDLVRTAVSSCYSCSKNRTINRKDNFRPILASGPWIHLQMDLVDLSNESYSSLPQNEGYKYILTIIDVYSKYAFAVPLKSKEMSQVAQEVDDICSTEGYPAIIHTDNGTEFVGQALVAFCNENNIQMRHGRARKPTTQGQIERFNQTLQRMLTITADANGTEFCWYPILRTVLRAYNNVSTHSSHGTTPFVMLKCRKCLHISPKQFPNFIGQKRWVRITVNITDKQVNKQCTGALKLCVQNLPIYVELGVSRVGRATLIVKIFMDAQPELPLYYLKSITQENFTEH